MKPARLGALEALLELFELPAKREQLGLAFHDFIVNVCKAAEVLSRVGASILWAERESERFIGAQPIADGERGDAKGPGGRGNATTSFLTIDLLNMPEDLGLFCLRISLSFGIGFGVFTHWGIHNSMHKLEFTKFILVTIHIYVFSELK